MKLARVRSSHAVAVRAPVLLRSTPQGGRGLVRAIPKVAAVNSGPRLYDRLAAELSAEHSCVIRFCEAKHDVFDVASAKTVSPRRD